MQSCIEHHESGVALLPRGHAKTTWGNTIFLSWLIAINQDIRIGLISNTAKQSNAFARAIRWTMESSERYKEIFGNLVSAAKWTDTEFLRKDSSHHRDNNVTLYSNGALGAIISKRFDVILCDDILDAENTAGIDQQEKVEEWFWKTLKPCLVPGGSIIVLGTRWAENDLYQRLIDPRPTGRGWRSLVKGAILVDEADQASALWPEIWPLDALLREKDDLGMANFACSYMNDISGLAEGNIFRREWIQYFDLRDIADKQLTYTMGVDLASSERERADYTARVVVGEDEEHNHYVFSVYRDKRSTGHRQFVIDGAAAYPRLSKIVIENQQFQSTLVADLLKSTSLPIVGKRADTDKRTRARAAAARYESHKVFHHRSLAGSEFEIELLNFPATHDDMIDALGMALDLSSTQMVFGTLPR